MIAQERMRKAEFLAALEDVLQLEEAIDENQNLLDLEEWDSLSKMAVMAYYKKTFSVDVNLNDLKNIQTVSDLIKLAGNNIDG